MRKTTNTIDVGSVALYHHMGLEWSPGILAVVVALLSFSLTLREMSEKTDVVSGEPWKSPLLGKPLVTAFRALLSPKGKKMRNAEILQSVLNKILTSQFQLLNKHVCFTQDILTMT